MKSPVHARAARRQRDRGVALILVMLAVLVLSALVAAMVFSARSETLASYNYKLDTQADYLAKAGIQEALNWFRSQGYQPVLESQASTYYQVTSDGGPYNLYTANASPVLCSSGCSSNGSQVQLIGILGSGSTNYPNIANSSGTLVATAFSQALSNVRVTGNTGNSGTFSVNAVLVNYQTVNSPVCAQSWIAKPCPVETWLITSQGTWTGNSGSSGTIAKTVETAIIQPIFLPYWSDALYGYCSVSMGGSAGTCTDSFNSALGAYAGGNNHTASGACDSASTNVIAAGANVGANGGVSLGSNVAVAGDVLIGSGAPAGCAANGFSGNASSVLGEVITGPHVEPPALPSFPSDLSSSDTPSYSSSVALPLPSVNPWPSTFPSSYTPPLSGFTGGPCGQGDSCDGSASEPFMINSISIASTNVVQLIGGPNIYSPVYYDIYNLGESGQAQIQVSGYVVLNVENSLSLTGNGITNGISTDIPPEAVQINYAGTSASIGGNGAVSAVVTAPNATVSLGGGGSSGYMVGAIRAANVFLQGGYPVHYDIQLNRLGGGTLSVPVVSAYSRKKF